MSEDKSKLQLIGEIAQANNKNLELIEELNDKEEEIERLNNKIQDLQADYGNIAQVERDFFKEENKRLNNIIKEVREYIDKEHKLLYLDKSGYTYTKMGSDILEILDKENK